MTRFLLTAALFLALSGCGTSVNSDFPNRIVGPQDQRITLEDIDAITADLTLTDEQKRDRLRDLGLQDEKLIDALLGG